MKSNKFSKIWYLIIALFILLVLIAYVLFVKTNNQIVTKDSSNSVSVPDGQVALTPAEVTNKQVVISQTLESPPVKLTSAQIKAKELLLKQLQTNQ